MDPKTTHDNNGNSNGSLIEATSNLLVTGQYSDIKFHIGPDKVEFVAHKLILIARSSVFATMLDNTNSHGQWAETKSGVIELPDVDPDDFKIFLEFVYTDGFKAATMSNVMQLLDLAVKYDISLLAEKCSNLTKGNINLDSCTYIYECAQIYGQTELEQLAWNYIKNAAGNLISHKSFEIATKSTLIALISSRLPGIAEQDLFQAILRWAKKECARQNIPESIENQREMLKDILEHIKFTNMTPEEFTLNVAEVGILTAEEENKIYRQICNPRFSTGRITAGIEQIGLRRNRRHDVIRLENETGK